MLKDDTFLCSKMRKGVFERKAGGGGGGGEGQGGSGRLQWGGMY